MNYKSLPTEPESILALQWADYEPYYRELEARSLTKENIDEWLDEYEQEEIMDYFKTCSTSDLKVAQQELEDGAYNWEQLKIMRIKFLSEYGM